MWLVTAVFDNKALEANNLWVAQEIVVRRLRCQRAGRGQVSKDQDQKDTNSVDI